MKPVVSIVVPIYNVEQYLDRCLDSITRQTLREIEIILVDDGSPDACPQMCDQWAAKDDRIKVVHKKNGGLGYARNSGMEVATGEYIAFIDSDDYIDLTMMEALYDRASRDGLDAVFCGVKNVDKDGKVYWVHKETSEYKIYEGSEECHFLGIESIYTHERTLAYHHYISVWHGIYNLGFLRENKLTFCSERDFISEDMIFDVDFFAKARRVGYVPECFNYYCDNGVSLSNTFRLDRFERYISMWKELKRRTAVNDYGEAGIISANKCMINFARNSAYSYFRHVDDKQQRSSLLKYVLSKRDIWQAVCNAATRNTLPFSMIPFYYILKYNLYYMAVLYCKIKTKK